MNSFSLRAVGQLARDPEATVKEGVTYTRFCLIGNDYVGRDEGGAAREVVTSLWFTAFNSLADAIANNARKGDQLFVEACIRSNTWKDSDGATQYSESYIVQGFRFGAPGRARREELQAREEQRRKE